MNCQDFNDIADEYVDEALSAAVQAAARQHLDRCDECRRALQRHTMASNSIRQALERASAGVSVRPGMQRRILQAMASEPVPDRHRVGLWQWLTSGWVRRTVAGAALVGVLFLVLGVRVHHGPTPDTRAVNQGGFDEYVIDVPIQQQTYVFQRQNDRVMDAVVPSDDAGHARLVAKSESEP